MPKSPHTSDDRERCVRACAASAAANGGTPRFLDLEREHGPTRHTLRRWWLEAGSPVDAGPVKAKAKRAKRPAEWTAARLLGDDDPIAVSRALVERLQGLAEEARARGSYTAAAKLEVELRRAVLEDRERHHAAGPRGPETPEEWKARAAQYPQLVAEVVAEEPALWDAVLSGIAFALASGTPAPASLGPAVASLARVTRS